MKKYIRESLEDAKTWDRTPLTVEQMREQVRRNHEAVVASKKEKKD